MFFTSAAEDHTLVARAVRTCHLLWLSLHFKIHMLSRARSRFLIVKIMMMDDDGDDEFDGDNDCDDHEHENGARYDGADLLKTCFSVESMDPMD